MSETKFTPGPWSVEIEEYEERSGTIAISEINRMLHDPEWADSEDWDRDLANAHLIAAAPELYKMLERCAALCEPHSAARDARVLLAKARGGESA